MEPSSPHLGASLKRTSGPSRPTLLDGAGVVSLILLGVNLLPPHSSIRREWAMLLVVSWVLMGLLSRRSLKGGVGSGWQALEWGTGHRALGATWLLSASLLLKTLLDQAFGGISPRESLKVLGGALPALGAVSISRFVAPPGGSLLMVCVYFVLTFMVHPSEPKGQLFRRASEESLWFGLLLWAASLGTWPLTGALALLIGVHALEEPNEEELRESLSRQMLSTEGTLRASQKRFHKDKSRLRSLLSLQGALDDFQRQALTADSYSSLSKVLVRTVESLDEGCLVGVCRTSDEHDSVVTVEGLNQFSPVDFIPFPKNWKPGQMLRSQCGYRFFFALNENLFFMLSSNLSKAKLKERHEEFLEHLLARAKLIVHILGQKQELAELVEQKSAALNQLADSQDRLIQSQKLASIGQLAAGVAHEINSPLAAIHLQAQLARRRLAKNDTDGVLRSLETCQQAGKRASAIIENLLAFSQYSDGVREPLLLSDLVEQNLRMLEGHFEDSEIAVTVEPHKPLVPQDMNAQEIGQILTNITVNAVDALKERPEGRRLVVSYSITSEKQAVTIANNGPAIAEETLNKLFDPFFTTKEVGGGTGLGLSIAYQLAQGHGGTLLAENRDGWVRFTLVLPTSSAAATASAGLN